VADLRQLIADRRSDRARQSGRSTMSQKRIDIAAIERAADSKIFDKKPLNCRIKLTLNNTLPKNS
jgi:hypothetical protein